jgi:hypothetical protein
MYLKFTLKFQTPENMTLLLVMIISIEIYIWMLRVFMEQLEREDFLSESMTHDVSCSYKRIVTLFFNARMI